MGKWCGDENCLQCGDKEPDPYVHLTREEYTALREQSRVLREALQFYADPQTYGKHGGSVNRVIADGGATAKAALTATSQPVQKG